MKATTMVVLAASMILLGCPQTNPVTSTDAAVLGEGPAPPPPTPATGDAGCFDTSGAPQVCIDACKALVRAGCVQLCSCPVVLANAQAHHTRPNPANNRLPLACGDLLAVQTPADVTARGWSCGGP